MSVLRKTVLAGFCLFAFASAGFAFDADDLNSITFRNNTAREIEYLFISPGDSDHWGPELLGATRVLPAGQSLSYFMLYPNTRDAFDIMAIDSSGKAFTIWDHQVTDGVESAISFTNKNMRDDATELEYVTVTIRNEVLPILYLFISPDDSKMWGADFLDDETILEMEEEVSFVFALEDDPITYNLLAVDEDGDTYSFSFDIDENCDGDTFAIDFEDLE